MRRDSEEGRPRLHLTSSGAALGAALLAGIGLLIPIYTSANRDLSGFRFIGAIALAAGAIVLLVEGVQRIRGRRQGPLLCGLGAGLALASLLLALWPANSDAGGDGGLRLDLRPTAPSIFRLAFEREIPLPRAGEGWAELRRRGGIDVGDSHFRLILANEGSRPISVLAVRVEVLGSKPMPSGTEAHQYTQGDEGVDRFLAFLPDGRKGSVAQVYAPGNRAVGREELEAQTPFFGSRYVLLRPGEVYPAALTVEAETARTISYRLVAEGESANRRFVVHSRVYRLVGAFEDRYQERFSRYYTHEHDPSTCTENPDNPWIDSRFDRRSLACPYGPGHPYEERPPSAAEYPPGRFQLSLRLGRGRQSAAISGVAVGTAPASEPVADVVKPLLRSLGSWTSCTVFLPSPSYWTARWEAWNLDLIFSGDGGTTDCTPRSHAEVREIAIHEPPGKVETELGSIVLGSRSVPKEIERLAEPGEEPGYEPVFVVPGSAPCNPGKPDSSRYGVADDLPSGILSWAEEPPSRAVSEVRITLPDHGC
jgi:hypothetical protein